MRVASNGTVVVMCGRTPPPNLLNPTTAARDRRNRSRPATLRTPGPGPLGTWGHGRGGGMPPLNCSLLLNGACSKPRAITRFIGRYGRQMHPDCIGAVATSYLPTIRVGRPAGLGARYRGRPDCRVNWWAEGAVPFLWPPATEIGTVPRHRPRRSRAAAARRPTTRTPRTIPRKCFPIPHACMAWRTAR
jgi:hypothetical protein